MTEERRTIGVVVTRRRLSGPWQDHQWLPTAVLAAAPAAPPWTRLTGTEAEDTYYAGPAHLVLHPGETANYRDNLLSARPSVWVVLNVGPADAVEIVQVTADPYEGEAFAENVGVVVEAVPMPADLRQWITGFFEAHHVEREFYKRRRDRQASKRPGDYGVASTESEDEP